MTSCWIRDRHGAEIKVMRRRESDVFFSQQFFKVSHTTFQIVDVGAGNFSFRNRVETNALDACLFA